jgi:hypothetical protein
MSVYRVYLVRGALVLLLAGWIALTLACGGANSGKAGGQGATSSGAQTCFACGGSGIVTTYQPAPHDPSRPGGGGQWVTYPCGACGGTGKSR